LTGADHILFEVVFGVPEWIRISGLQRWSYQAIKQKNIAAQSFHKFCAKLNEDCKKTGVVVAQRPRFFKRFSK